jgi:hypothetical protein
MKNLFTRHAKKEAEGFRRSRPGSRNRTDKLAGRFVRSRQNVRVRSNRRSIERTNLQNILMQSDLNSS